MLRKFPRLMRLGRVNGEESEEVLYVIKGTMQILNLDAAVRFSIP